MSVFYQNRKERIRFYISVNNSFATHLHRQVELLTVLSGEIVVTVDHAVYTVKAGEGAIVFPNQLHSLKTRRDSRILLCIFDPDYCHGFRRLFQNHQPTENVFALDGLTVHGRTALKGLLDLTEALRKSNRMSKDMLSYSEGYLTLLLTDLFSLLTLQARPSSEDLELEQQLLLYLEDHYTEKVSLELLAHRFGVSRFVLSRLFTEKLHTTFPDYINAKRLEYAQDLLLTTDLSVTQIALDAGFGSSRTFFRVFQDAFHTTPRAYRRDLLNREP